MSEANLVNTHPPAVIRCAVFSPKAWEGSPSRELSLIGERDYALLGGGSHHVSRRWSFTLGMMQAELRGVHGL